MSGKKIYQIIKNRVAESGELALRERQILERRNVSAPESGYFWRKKIGPLATTIAIWCCCIPVTYYIWKREKAKRDLIGPTTEELSVETETEEKQSDGFELSKAKKGFFGSRVAQEEYKYFKDGKPDLEENPGRHCTINYEKERVEILQCNSLTWYIRVVPFSQIQCDCNGKLKFDEEGNPVRIPWSFRNFFSELHEALKVKRV